MKLELFPIFQSLLNFIFKKLSAIFSDLTIRGRENIPPKEPLIVISNHTSTMDPVLIRFSINRPTVFLVKKELFRSFIFSLILRALGNFPVTRGKADLKALKWAYKQVEGGRVLVIFPEGKRSKDLQLGKGNIGTALIAATTGYTVLPIGITGTEAFQNVLQLFKPSGSMSVNVGQPFKVKEVTRRPNRKTLTLLTEEMMTHIACLLPQEQRGAYTKTTSPELIHTTYLTNGT